MLCTVAKIEDTTDCIASIAAFIEGRGEFICGMAVGFIVALLFIKALKIVITPDSVKELDRVIVSQAKLLKQKDADIALKDTRLGKCHSALEEERLRNYALTQKLEELSPKA